MKLPCVIVLEFTNLVPLSSFSQMLLHEAKLPSIY